MKFVDVKNDIAFRKIFGNENKKEILISFLNAVLELPEGKRIKNTEIKNPFQMPEIKGLKSSILDVLATDERNISYIVEMQVEEPDGFDKRVQYYTAKQYSAQINIADDYPLLNQVIFIGIINFNFFSGKEYLTKHLIINTKTGKQELKDIEFNFIELPKFKKKQTELDSLIDKWTFFIKNAPNLDVIPTDIGDKGLIRAYEDAAQYNWTKDELEAYDYAAMRKQDEIGKIELKLRRGIEAAVINTKIDMIKKCCLIGLSIQDAVKLSEMSKDDVTKIYNELKNNN